MTHSVGGGSKRVEFITMSQVDFGTTFQVLTGNFPFPWQEGAVRPVHGR